MEQGSFWRASAAIPERAPLSCDIETEIAIVGGGLTGLLTAHFLKQSGRKCVVVEAERIGSGQTGNTTAKVTSQHGMIYDRLIRSVGRERAKQYAEANQAAIERYRILIEKYRIDCDWMERPAYLYTTKQAKELRREYKAAAELGLPAELTGRTELPFPVEQALRFNGQASFHPLKFLKAIAGDAEIYERTKALRAEPHLLVTDRGKVKAEQIVFAGHYPFVLWPGYYFLRMHQERSYVAGFRNAPHFYGMYLGIDEDGLSFRQAGDLLLLGGGNCRTGEAAVGNPYDYLLHEGDCFWPQARAVRCWAAQDCMTLDGIPYIGRFGKHTDGWYVATGFGKWGMTSAMVSAVILTDLICGRANPYADVFSPQRRDMAACAKTFLEEGKYAAANLLRERLAFPREKLDEIRPGTGKVVEFKGKKAGVYRDEEGSIYAVSVKCPHLGCQLAWNPCEKSWDCPCHGSRYDYRGRLLDGPAQTASLTCDIKHK